MGDPFIFARIYGSAAVASCIENRGALGARKGVCWRGGDMKIVMVVFMLLASVSCMAEPEEMIQVNREYDRQKMVEMFVSENVPYKILNENQIY